MRPPHFCGRHVGGGRDGLDHDTFQRTLVQVTGDEPGQEGPLAGARACEQGREQPPPLRLRSWAGGRADLCEDRVNGGERETGGGDRGLTRGLLWGARARVRGRGFLRRPDGARWPGDTGDIPKCGIAHADLALAQLSGQKCDRDRNLPRLRAAEQVRDRLDLGAA